MTNRNTGLTGVQQVTALALRSHTMADDERLAEITRAVCASPAVRKAAARGGRNTRQAATLKHVTGRRGDNDRPAIACHLLFVAPFSFGLTIDGRAARRRFEKALPDALRTLTEDCWRARELLAEHPCDSGDHRPNASLLGDDESYYTGRINLPPTLTDEALAALMPEIEAKARDLFDEALRRTRQALANKEVCHV
ncbi:hypothetical protein VSR69_33015 [Paraburkholderia phytofirmans]|uniref:hypothetical protein n=1 Tax=Paraburkholderia sp. BL9I2N2 TaxID=1938809 RepID=UPI001048AE69|nr:hypothetical protein [Paraburkholderia sp. BL9I2N2]TCK96018.1 hypothetical protein B0G74_2662 [Paraburkholderia sp. BL9I2N2]